jgi:hypothetical protein
MPAQCPPPSKRNRDVPQPVETAAKVVMPLALMLAVAACGEDSPSPSPAASPTYDLAAIACATDDPTGVGELTGAWLGSEGGVYYLRHVGDCVWWFGTEVDDIQPGVTGQPGFANVASGRFDGAQLTVEWADIPLGNVQGGGGLTFVYDVANDRLLLTEQRGDWTPFGGTELTRIDPEASPEAMPSASPSR